MTELEGYTKFSEIDEKKLELQWIASISKVLVGKSSSLVNKAPPSLPSSSIDGVSQVPLLKRI